MELLNSSMCYGCSGCSQTCIHSAITMDKNKYGYYIPNIDKDMCVECKECQHVCPQFNDLCNSNYSEPFVYAACAENDIRETSSSGGAFYVIAENILSAGGIVYGASYCENFSVKHICVNNVKDLHLLQKSKYVQSYMGECYAQIRRNLSEGKKVLFSGTPCQIAGLYLYLGNLSSSELLLTIDLVCFGVPSQLMLQSYLDQKFDVEQIENIDFRDKRYGWNCTTHTVNFKGSENAYRNEKDEYSIAFHNGLMRNNVCEYCKYDGFPRVGDITLGDFWGINQYKRELDDNKGTSLILVNNSKAKQIVESVAEKFIVFESLPFQHSLFGENRIHGRGLHNDEKRKQFRENILEKAFKDSVTFSLSSKKDVGLVCLTNYNVGNNLTNLSLYSYIVNQGYSVSLIPQNRECGFVDFEDGKQLKYFSNNPYGDDFIQRNPSIEERFEYNYKCNMFLLGSDQCLRDKFVSGMNYHSLMYWVSDSKYKAIYAGSFGVDKYVGDKEFIKKSAALLSRMNRISVREKSGCDIIETVFRLSAEFVADPVFLNDKEFYREFSKDFVGKFPSKYVCMYFLDMNVEREQFVDSLHSVFDKKYIYLDRQQIDNPYKGKKDYYLDFTNEEWVAAISDSDFFITDSFHGVCFALILEKQFCVLHNKWQWRGIERLESILNYLGLEDRLCKSVEEYREKKLYDKKIDYFAVNKKLNAFIEHSKKWLDDTLCEGKSYHITEDENCTNELLKEDFLLIKSRVENESKIQRENYETIKRTVSYRLGRFLTYIPWWIYMKFIRKRD